MPIDAGYEIMAQKGIDAATMSEIAELADLGAGTVYNYFASKDELVMYVMEQVMDQLAQRIEAVTNGFTDPAHVFAFGIRNVMIAATIDQRWRWLLRRSEVIASAMSRVMGPHAIREYSQCRGGPTLPNGRSRIGLAASHARHRRL